MITNKIKSTAAINSHLMGLVARLFCLRFAVSIFFSSFSMYLAFFQIQLNSMGCGFFMMIRSELIVGFRARESRKKRESKYAIIYDVFFGSCSVADEHRYENTCFGSRICALSFSSLFVTFRLWLIFSSLTQTNRHKSGP